MKKKSKNRLNGEVEFTITSTGESRERVNFRVPRELWNDVKKHIVVEKELAREEAHLTEPTTTDVLVNLLKLGLKSRQAFLHQQHGPKGASLIP